MSFLKNFTYEKSYRVFMQHTLYEVFEIVFKSLTFYLEVFI